MSCGCGKAQDEALAGTVLRTSMANENSAGLYDTASAPGCEEPYHGAYARSNTSIYVVDINGPNEKLFRRTQRDEAVYLARTQNLTLARLHPSNLCHSLVVELLGG